MSAEQPLPPEVTQELDQPNAPIETTEQATIEEEDSVEERNQYAFDGILVFGHGWSNRSYQLSLEAKMRAIAAYQLWKDGLAPRIILTGGEPGQWQKDQYPGIVSNAEQMRQMLIKLYRVPESAIEYENESFKTVDNVAHAVNKLDSLQLPRENFVTVSTAFHLDRINKIMAHFNIAAQPISAEEGLNQRAKAHADMMRERDVARGLSTQEVERRWWRRAHRYAKQVERIKLMDETIKGELKDEPRWQEAMDSWGYWGPLALAVRGEKLRELVTKYKDDIEAWLGRHPEIEVTMEDLIEGNFNYRELVDKGREIPPQS